MYKKLLLVMSVLLLFTPTYVLAASYYGSPSSGGSSSGDSGGSSIFSSIFNEVSSIGSSIVGGITSAVSTVKEVVVDPIVEAVSDAYTWIKENVYDPAAEKVSNAIDWVKEKVFTPVVDTLKEGAKKIAESVSDTYNDVKKWISDTKDKIIEDAKEAIEKFFKYKVTIKTEGVSGALIKLEGGSVSKSCTTTWFDLCIFGGSYCCSIGGLDEGDYTVTGSKTGYEGDSTIVTVNDDKTVSLDLKELKFDIVVETSVPKVKIIVDGIEECTTDDGFWKVCDPLFGLGCEWFIRPKCTVKDVDRGSRVFETSKQPEWADNLMNVNVVNDDPVYFEMSEKVANTIIEGVVTDESGEGLKGLKIEVEVK